MSTLEDMLATTDNELREVEKKLQALTEKADDMETRTRGDNIRFVGLKEGAARGDRPRPVIIKLNNSGGKQRIMAALRERRQVTHEGQKRRSFNKVCERLIGVNIRFFMWFPAVRTFTYNGEKHAFQTPRAAQAFVDGLP